MMTASRLEGEPVSKTAKCNNERNVRNVLRNGRKEISNARRAVKSAEF
jgi:hypothetical protein